MVGNETKPFVFLLMYMYMSICRLQGELMDPVVGEPTEDATFCAFRSPDEPTLGNKVCKRSRVNAG